MGDDPHLGASIMFGDTIIYDAQMQVIVNEYDQEIPQSQTADNPVAPRGT